MQSAASHRIGDLLQIGQSEQLNVVHPEAAVGDRGGDRSEHQRFPSLIQLEVKVRILLLVWTRHEIEAGALPGASQIGEQSKVREDARVVGS
jgi:hypothetical protein